MYLVRFIAFNKFKNGGLCFLCFSFVKRTICISKIGDDILLLVFEELDHPQLLPSCAASFLSEAMPLILIYYRNLVLHI